MGIISYFILFFQPFSLNKLIKDVRDKGKDTKRGKIYIEESWMKGEKESLVLFVPKKSKAKKAVFIRIMGFKPGPILRIERNKLEWK